MPSWSIPQLTSVQFTVLRENHFMYLGLNDIVTEMCLLTLKWIKVLWIWIWLICFWKSVPLSFDLCIIAFYNVSTFYLPFYHNRYPPCINVMNNCCTHFLLPTKGSNAGQWCHLTFKVKTLSVKPLLLCGKWKRWLSHDPRSCKEN